MVSSPSERCGLMVSSPGPCASSGGRLPEAFFMLSRLDSNGAKVQTFVYLVDLEQSGKIGVISRHIEAKVDFSQIRVNVAK